MKQSLQLRLGQHLTMTPQLQQAIKLLQLSALELQTEVQQALESNPLLEVAEENENEAEFTDYEAGEVENLAAAEPPPVEAMAEPGPEFTHEDGSPPGMGEGQELAIDRQEIPEDLPVDSSWDDIYDTPSGPAGSSDFEQRSYDTQEAGTNLHDHLLWQLEMAPFTPTDLAIAEAIIDAIDDDGYLSVSLEEIRQGLSPHYGVEPDEMEAVLHRIQNFDPPGVGARDLKECLMIQFKQCPVDIPFLEAAKTLVKDHINLLADKDFSQIKRRLRLDDESLAEVVHLIQSLNPRPGSRITSAKIEYIVPDVIVKKQKGAWRVELNPEAMPRVRINPHYAAMIRRADNSRDNTYLKNHLQEARWFLKSLQSRNETLLRVAGCIVERQRAFLDHGEEAMKALVLHDVAEAVGMHESTISRVTTKKYMLTPRGIYELKYFFSSHVTTSEGGACSSTAIRALIKKLVAAENPRKPLSDSKLASMLTQQGINVARRTIAKYREAMAIPPSNERKRFV